MLMLQNTCKRVICIGEKNFIPGTEPIEVTQEEAKHPMIKRYIKAKELELSEVNDIVIEPAAETVNEDDNKKPPKK